MTPFEGTSTCIETARPPQLLEVLSSVCALVFLSSRSLTSLQTSGGPLTSSRITPDSLLPFVHPPPLSSTCTMTTNAYKKPLSSTSRGTQRLNSISKAYSKLEIEGLIPACLQVSPTTCLLSFTCPWLKTQSKQVEDAPTWKSLNTVQSNVCE